MQGLAATVTVPSADLPEVQLGAAHLPTNLIVIALRLVISTNDNSPQDFQMLLSALDDDMEAALEVYAGTNFDEEVVQVAISVQGSGPEQAFDPFYLGEPAHSIMQAERLIVEGWAPHMPAPETEDILLQLAAMRAFLPVGTVPDYEPGDEEYFARGDDLLIDEVSIEHASLRAILALLAPGKEPKLRQEG